MNNDQLREEIVKIFSELITTYTDGTGDYNKFQRSPSSEEEAYRIEQQMLKLVAEHDLEARVDEINRLVASTKQVTPDTQIRMDYARIILSKRLEEITEQRKRAGIE